jgi:NTE family protein
VLANTEISWDGQQRRLLDEVDFISGVSGGSFTAAYYGLYGDRIFDDFEPLFLKRDVQGTLIKNMFAPANWLTLGSALYDRGDMAADYYNELLFKNATFADMQARAKAPQIIINATDATLGTQFTFNQAQFDLLCSDLSQFPVARAVAASSAVPILFSSISLYNYAGQCAFHPPAWAAAALKDRDTTSRRYHTVQEALSYLDREARPYIHLFDGGLSDNLGIRPLLRRVDLMGGGWEALQAGDIADTRKVVVIIVNAETAIDSQPNLSPDSVPLSYTISSSASVPLDLYSFETIELLREKLAVWDREIKENRCNAAKKSLRQAAEKCDDFEYYIIDVNFDRLADAKERDYFKHLSTSFFLPAEDVDRLHDAAARILAGSDEFQRLLGDLR